MAITVTGPHAGVLARAADDEATALPWAELVAMVHRQMRSLTGPSNDLEDLTQAALEQVVRVLERFRGDGEVSTFTYRICVNVVLNHRRWWRRWLARFALDDDGPEGADSALGPVELTLERERLVELYACLDRLAPAKRVTLILADLEELPASRIAEIMRCPEPTVRSRLRQARGELTALLSRAPAFAEEKGAPR
jgi:RNA polymerase sigma-70 factor (ECF subfamily)